MALSSQLSPPEVLTGDNRQSWISSLYRTISNLRDDVRTVRVATITKAAAANAAASPPTQAEFNTLVALVNEIRTAINNAAAASLKTP